MKGGRRAIEGECEAEVEAFKATYKAECEGLKAQVEAAVRRHIRLTYKACKGRKATDKAEYVRIVITSMDRAYEYQVRIMCLLVE